MAPRIGPFGAMQALPGVQLGKGAKKGQLTTEILKAIPFKTKMRIIQEFRNYANDPSQAPAEDWRVVEFILVIKNILAHRLTDLRWVSNTEVLQKWYLGSLMRLVRPKIGGGEVKSYGFRKGCSVNEVRGEGLSGNC